MAKIPLENLTGELTVEGLAGQQVQLAHRTDGAHAAAKAAPPAPVHIQLLPVCTYVSTTLCKQAIPPKQNPFTTPLNHLNLNETCVSCVKLGLQVANPEPRTVNFQIRAKPCAGPAAACIAVGLQVLLQAVPATCRVDMWLPMPRTTSGAS